MQDEYVRCSECAQYHRGKLKKTAEVQKMLVDERFERISIDITGPHPKSSKENRFILTVVNHFTKYAEGFPIANHEAVTVARHLVKGWLLRFGSPLQILSDRGAEFEGHLFAELSRLLEID